MSVTLQDLKDIFYSILREEESDASSYPTLLATQMINSAQQSICSGRIVDPLNWQEVCKGDLPFLNSTQWSTNVQMTSLSIVTTVWATELDAVTTNYPTAWVLYIQGDIVTYTWTSATQFTGCVWVSYARPAATSVSIAFALPDDYMSPINVVYDKKMQLNTQVYDDIYENLNDWKGSGYQNEIGNNGVFDWGQRRPQFYSIKDGKYMILFNLNKNGAVIRLRYVKKPTEMVDSTDLATIDDDIIAKETIPYLAVGEILFNRWEEGRGAQMINFGVSKLKQMYTHYTNQTYQDLNGTQYGMAKGNLNI